MKFRILTNKVPGRDQFQIYLLAEDSFTGQSMIAEPGGPEVVFTKISEAEPFNGPWLVLSSPTVKPFFEAFVAAAREQGFIPDRERVLEAELAGVKVLSEYVKQLEQRNFENLTKEKPRDTN